MTAMVRVAISRSSDCRSGWQESAGASRSSNRRPGFMSYGSTPLNRARETRSRPALQTERRPFTRGLASQTSVIGFRKRATPELGISTENTFIYIRGYPSKAERDRRLTAAHDDPEFAEVVTKQERNADTKLIVKAHNIDMVPNGSYSTIKIVP
jgi:hypothetical protein